LTAVTSSPILTLPQQLQTLLKDENPFLLVLQEMMDGILICDEKGQVLFFNESLKNVFHLPQQSLDKPCDQVIPGDALMHSIRSVLENGQSVSEEITLNCGNQEKTFQFHGVPLNFAKDKQNQVSACVAVFHDITAIKRTEKMRRDFVANVSHELRTPLSAIKGYAETLLDGALEDQEVSHEFVEVIHKHSLRLSRLVEDLLDLSKLESPDFMPELRPVSLKPVISRAMALVENNVSGKSLTLFTHIPEDLPKVFANISNLEQVFTNLLDNAIKYTPAGGKIAVSAFETDGFVQVSVKDTGLGMEPKHIPRLFERFYRVDKARSRDLGGTGLGLSIVKHIIQYHGGEIWVESELNKGSTFTFTLRKVGDAYPHEGL
jgi:two-component system, OmpR family, phosphate regulon sensor histidine kinase PhoR